MAKVVTLGEIMLRLSTDYGKLISNSQTLDITFGGGEANVAVSLANFGHQVAFASKVPDNELGRSVLKTLKSFNVATDYLLFGGNRLGTYYIESGVGNRASTVIYDRQFSSFSEMTVFDWNDSLFTQVDVFHISGITPGLSKEWQELTLNLIMLAKNAGCKISFDINYRSKIWDKEAYKQFLKDVFPLVDYCSAGKLDAIHFFDIPVYDKEKTTREIEMTYYYQQIQKKYPNIVVIYSTERVVYSSNKHDLTGLLWMEKKIIQSETYCIEPVVDRVGGGDAFAAGILHGILSNYSIEDIVEFGTAAAVLKHSIYGDFNQFLVKDVLSFMQAKNSEIKR